MSSTIESHTDKAEKKRKRENISSTKNKPQDLKKFIASVSKLIIHSDTNFYEKKKKLDEENTDQLLETIKHFLTNIKSDEMVREAIQHFTNEVFTQNKWELYFYRDVIRKLKEDPSDASKRVLKLIMGNQSNRFESVKLLFQFVNHIMILKEDATAYKVSASRFMELLKGADNAHIKWLQTSINAVINCYNYEPNVDAQETLRNILNDYIDVWTFYIYTPSQKNRYLRYKSMVPEKSLSEIRMTIMKMLYPNVELRTEVLSVVVMEESKFRQRKKRLKNTTVKIRSSLAFEVHRVRVGLHLTKHLMRNYVTNRSSKDIHQILEKVKSCPYQFYLKFESVKMMEIMKKVGFSVLVCDQIVHNRTKQQELRVAIPYRDDPEIEEVDGNFWVWKTIDLPFRFTSCNSIIEIPEIGNEELVRGLFGLDTKMVYQVFEMPNFKCYEQGGMKKRIKPIREKVFDMGVGYLDEHYYAYEVTPRSLSNNKVPVRVIVEGRPMSKLSVETPIKTMNL